MDYEWENGRIEEEKNRRKKKKKKKKKKKRKRKDPRRLGGRLLVEIKQPDQVR